MRTKENVNRGTIQSRYITKSGAHYYHLAWYVFCEGARNSYCCISLAKIISKKKKKETSSVYDCTVEDVE